MHYQQNDILMFHYSFLGCERVNWKETKDEENFDVLHYVESCTTRFCCGVSRVLFHEIPKNIAIFYLLAKNITVYVEQFFGYSKKYNSLIY